ncbi:MAG: pseudouridine synthase [Myxococcales bacterium]|nr:pseudouridine synthase [Myxococcales bacterium]
MRLQRFLAQGGVASRRKAEELITSGQVKVNGRVVTELGSKVDPDADKVFVAGRRILAQRNVYILLNKPKGYVTTATDPEGRPTVMQLVPSSERLYCVGRLDYNTEGVLLITNDGDLAFALMHPSRGVEKTYHAKVQGTLNVEEIERLREGVTLDDGTKTRPAHVHVVGDTGNHTWVEIGIKEGKNRQIHRMAEVIGHPVLKLERVDYAGLTTEGVKLGRWRSLTSEEVAALREMSGARSTVVRKRSPQGRRPSTRTETRSEARADARSAPRSRAHEEPRKPPRHKPRGGRGQDKRGGPPAQAGRPGRGAPPARTGKPGRGAPPARTGKPTREGRPKAGR